MSTVTVHLLTLSHIKLISYTVQKTKYSSSRFIFISYTLQKTKYNSSRFIEGPIKAMQEDVFQKMVGMKERWKGNVLTEEKKIPGKTMLSK